MLIEERIVFCKKIFSQSE
jgi:hypothetical protein